MVNTDFGKLHVNIDSKKTEIEKEIIVQPDEQLLKKVEDPLEKIRKEEEEARRIRE